jgi:hypothetical protein
LRAARRMTADSPDSGRPQAPVRRLPRPAHRSRLSGVPGR